MMTTANVSATFLILRCKEGIGGGGGGVRRYKYSGKIENRLSVFPGKYYLSDDIRGSTLNSSCSAPLCPGIKRLDCIFIIGW